MLILDSIAGQQPTTGSQVSPATVNGTPPMEASPFRRCTGHCCRRFYLMGLTMKDVLENQRRSNAPCTALTWPQGIEKPGELQLLLGPVKDIDFIADMLLPTDSEQHFTCRHLDGDNCSKYDERPDLCRDFPSGGSGCEYADCTREA